LTVTCPYCSSPAVLTDSVEVYHGNSFGMIWLCRPCQAWVGVHKGTDKPLGRLANKELRDWKIKAHAAFDPIWEAKLRHRRAGGKGKSGKDSGGPGYKKEYARGAGYKWLAVQLGIPKADCHIGMFDVETCKRVVEICKPYADRLRRAA